MNGITSLITKDIKKAKSQLLSTLDDDSDDESQVQYCNAKSQVLSLLDDDSDDDDSQVQYCIDKSGFLYPRW